MRTPLNANITICKVEGYWNVIFDYVSVEFRSTHPLAFVHEPFASFTPTAPTKGGWLLSYTVGKV